MQLMIQIQDLAKTYKAADGEEVHAVKGLELEVRKGEILSLLAAAAVSFVFGARRFRYNL